MVVETENGVVEAVKTKHNIGDEVYVIGSRLIKDGSNQFFVDNYGEPTKVTTVRVDQIGENESIQEFKLAFNRNFSPAYRIFESFEDAEAFCRAENNDKKDVSVASHLYFGFISEENCLNADLVEFSRDEAVKHVTWKWSGNYTGNFEEFVIIVPHTKSALKYMKEFDNIAAKHDICPIEIRFYAKNLAIISGAWDSRKGRYYRLENDKERDEMPCNNYNDAEEAFRDTEHLVDNMYARSLSPKRK